MVFSTVKISHAGESSIDWGHLQSARQTATPATTAAKPVRAQRIIRDPQVVAATWEEADASLQEGDTPEVQSIADGRSVVVKRSTMRSATIESDRPEAKEPSYSEERFAQLPYDPFDETPEDGMADEPMPELEISEVQDALEDEIDRRDAEEDYDLFDAMTLDDDDQLGEGSEESLQYGGNLELSLPQPPNGELTEEQRRLLAEERAASEESCREEIDKLHAQTLETIDITIRVEGNMGEDYPFECALEEEPHEPRQWSQITYMWKAAGLCHKPLYFEQVQLERYGHAWGPYTQPIMSGVHFFGTLPILPYKMGLQTPNECVYTLGYYRPGNCAPYLVGGFPFTWRAAGFEASVATGLSFLIP